MKIKHYKKPLFIDKKSLDISFNPNDFILFSRSLTNTLITSFKDYLNFNIPVVSQYVKVPGLKQLLFRNVDSLIAKSYNEIIALVDKLASADKYTVADTASFTGAIHLYLRCIRDTKAAFTTRLLKILAGFGRMLQKQLINDSLGTAF